MGFSNPTLSLKGRALRLLGQREHSRAELERKLAAHVQEGDDLPAVLDELQARGFISQERVVESTLHRRAQRLGSARIRQELQSKGIDAEAIAQALAQLQPGELDRARAVWQRRFGGMPPADAGERARQMRFLMARGFSSEVAARTVRGGARSEDG